ncbi:MAG: dienelactone hydrolase family protein [Phycisphaeraceae bacterium]|nr:dienelactone hydrolase family protein [Phycisphaeraceae bacterium]
MKSFCLLLTALLVSLPAFAEVKTKAITYKDGDTTLTGHLAWDPEMLPNPGARVTEKAPAVLIVHQWMGLTDYEEGRAKQLAELGYVVFALDIYGSDFSPTNMQEAGKASGSFKNNRKLFRQRLNLGLDQLKKVNQVDPKRITAIGYCFGGTGVLELARSGSDVAGVVSFHGGLDAPTPEDAKNIKAKVLVLHGADDPFVPREGIDAMKKSFNEAEVDWQMIEYSGAVHSFTQPMAGDDNARGAAYNEKADKRSWHHMRMFFNETLGTVDRQDNPLQDF